MKNDWICQKHQQSPIVLVCTGNVWHFEGLCTNCVPEHTKNHPKHIKIQLQGIKEVMQKAIDIKKKVSHICQERLKQSQTLVSIKEEDFQFVNSLNEKRAILIKEINKTFDIMIEQTRQKREGQLKSQRESLAKLITSLEESITFFKKEEYSDISEFCRQIKKYYFKQNLDVYVEEYDEIIKQYREKVVQYNPFHWIKDLETKTKGFLKDCHKQEDPSEKKEKQEKQTKKEQPKRKEPGRRKCGKCGNEMEYLTEWKKHLVCRVCGGKQRNYIKK